MSSSPTITTDRQAKQRYRKAPWLQLWGRQEIIQRWTSRAEPRPKHSSPAAAGTGVFISWPTLKAARLCSNAITVTHWKIWIYIKKCKIPNFKNFKIHHLWGVRLFFSSCYSLRSQCENSSRLHNSHKQSVTWSEPKGWGHADARENPKLVNISEQRVVSLQSPNNRDLTQNQKCCSSWSHYLLQEKAICWLKFKYRLWFWILSYNN